jgi:hypothetical protein
MAHYRKTSGGLIEVIQTKKEHDDALLRGVVTDLGELIDVLKNQDQRVAKLEGDPDKKPLTLKLEKKLKKLNGGRGGGKKK